MRTLLLLTVLLVFYSNCKQLKYLEKFDGYYGLPKIVERTNYSLSKDEDSIRENFAYRLVSEYDRKGRKLKTYTHGSEDSSLFSGYKFYYDRKGNNVRNAVIIKDSINVLNNYAFNKYGQQIYREYIHRNTHSITRTEYDRKKRISVTKSVTNDILDDKKFIITYDSNWREIEIKTLNNSDILQRRTEKFYDEKGNMVLSKWYDSDNRLYEYFKTEYNDKNNRTKIEHFRIKSHDTTIINSIQFDYEYDEKGNIISETLISNGKRSTITRNKFHY